MQNYFFKQEDFINFFYFDFMDINQQTYSQKDIIDRYFGKCTLQEPEISVFKELSLVTDGTGSCRFRSIKPSGNSRA